jgi:hypothetical protein
LAKHPFNKSNIHEYAAWSLALDRAAGFEVAVGFSSEYKQVVFPALKLDDKIEGRYYTALLTFNYVNDSVDVTPFRRTDLRLESLDNVSSSWVNSFFDWDTAGRLRLRPNVQPPPFMGKLDFPDKDFISYKLYPARETIVPAFLNFLKNNYRAKGAEKDIVIIDETNKQSVLITYKVEIAGKAFHLTYDKVDMKLIFERHFNDAHSDSYRDMIISIGNSFNDELSRRRYQEHFGNYKGE